MIEGQDYKVGVLQVPKTEANSAAGLGRASVDTIGFDYATILIAVGNTVGAMTKCQIKQSDTSLSAVGWRDATDIVVTFDGANAATGQAGKKLDGEVATLPGNTDDKVFTVELDLRTKKRYIALDVIGVANNSMALAAVAILSRGKIAPRTMALKGVEQAIRAT
jgi:hypothetical protein